MTSYYLSLSQICYLGIAEMDFMVGLLARSCSLHRLRFSPDLLTFTELSLLDTRTSLILRVTCLFQFLSPVRSPCAKRSFRCAQRYTDTPASVARARCPDPPLLPSRR
jgi:hypothetical protein